MGSEGEMINLHVSPFWAYQGGVGGWWVRPNACQSLLCLFFISPSAFLWSLFLDISPLTSFMLSVTFWAVHRSQIPTGPIKGLISFSDREESPRQGELLRKSFSWERQACLFDKLGKVIPSLSVLPHRALLCLIRKRSQPKAWGEKEINTATPKRDSPGPKFLPGVPRETKPLDPALSGSSFSAPQSLFAEERRFLELGCLLKGLLIADGLHFI